MHTIARAPVIGLALFALSADPARAQVPVPDAPTSVLTKVDVDLNAKAFTRALPFDVPFFVTGTLPAGARTWKAIGTENNDRNKSKKKDVCRQDFEAELNGLPADGKFALFIGARLCADREYTFTFQYEAAIDAAVLTELRGLARAQFDQELRPINVGNMSSASARAVHRALQARLNALFASKEGDDWRTPPDALFPREGEPNIDRLLPAIGAVIGQQARRNAILHPIEPARRQLATMLKALRQRPDLRALAGAPDSLTTKADVAPLWRDTAAARALLDAGTDLDILGQGGSSVPLDGLSSAAQLAPFRASYDATFNALQQLDYLIKTVTGSALLTVFEPVLGTPVINSLATLPESAPAALSDRALQDASDTAFLLRDAVANVVSAITGREAALDALAAAVDAFALRQIQVTGSTTVSGETASSWYVSADAGFLYAPVLHQGAPYLGTNIYFRPVNKDAPLSQVSSFGRRASLTVGLTLTSIADEGTPKVRFDIFNNQSVVLGVGYRITQSMRAGAGLLLFRQADPNPNITGDPTLTSTFYMSLSFDMNIAKMIGGANSPFK